MIRRHKLTPLYTGGVDMYKVDKSWRAWRSVWENQNERTKLGTARRKWREFNRISGELSHPYLEGILELKRTQE